MITVTSFANQKVAVIGLGRTGTSASLALMKGKACVLSWDDRDTSRELAEKRGVPIFDLASVDWTEFAALILSPGISETHPYAINARQAGVPIICDVELLAGMQREATYIGITGTNGKSTTTWLISHLLRAAGRSIEVGGNIGIPALELAALEKDETYVLELSSYQLERIQTPFLKTAILLNITPDHLDRHGNMNGYVQAKEKVFKLQHGLKQAIIGIDDQECLTIFNKINQEKNHTIVLISTNQIVSQGVYVKDGILIDNLKNQAEEILDLKTISSLPGIHNWQNIAAAYAAVSLEGVDKDQFIKGLLSFINLPHRLERIQSIDDIHFINDSKATNAEAVAKALASYDTNIFWILGGRAKENGLEGLDPYYSRIEHAFLIGESMSRFAKDLEGKVSYQCCLELSKAVNEAYKKARSTHKRPAYILLSPACASWDQFKDYEHRGQVFKDLVNELMKEEAR